MKKKFGWTREKRELSRLRLWCNLILAPGVLLLFFYAVTGKVLNVPATYGIVDILVLIGITGHERIRRKRQRLEEKEEHSGAGMDNVRRKLEHMRKSEEN